MTPARQAAASAAAEGGPPAPRAGAGAGEPALGADKPAPLGGAAAASPPEPGPFAAPWEAQAFALAVALHERGLFTWPEWSAALGAALHEQDDYHRAWLAALERLVVAKGAASDAALSSYAAAWARAEARTPHGTAIELSDADFT